MAVGVKFSDFSVRFANGTHDFNNHVFKVALANVEPNTVTSTRLADIQQIPEGNGYAAGGNTTALSIASTAGITTISGTTVTFTANGGNIGPFRYFIFYNDSSATPNGALIAKWDHGSHVTIADGDSHDFSFGGTNPGPILTLE